MKVFVYLEWFIEGINFTVDVVVVRENWREEGNRCLCKDEKKSHFEECYF